MAARLFSLILVAICISRSTAVTLTEETNAKAECQAALDVNDDFIAGFVRLAFHDCVGGCDGCFNDNIEDNAGLNRYATALQKAYEKGTAYHSMSRADFWALCGAEALQRGHKNARNNDPAPPVKVRYGRKHCTNLGSIPAFHDASAMHEFPSAIRGLAHLLNFFAKEFHFSDQETVALLGAHSLGRARTEDSGFEGPWVAAEKAFDNKYFVDMLDRQGRFKWTQRNVGTDRLPRWQYSHEDGEALMFNADICMVTDIEPDRSGREERDLSSISDSSTRKFVEYYANNNAKFLEDFGKVYTKMIEHGATNELKEAGDLSTGKTRGRRSMTLKDANQERRLRMLARLFADQN